MKKLILGVIAFTFFALSCSSEEDLTEEEQSILGTWEIVASGYIDSNGVETINQINDPCQSTYKFTPDKIVNWKSYYTCETLYEEIGTWSLVNGLLTRTFPDHQVILWTDNITFINPDRIKLVPLGNLPIFEIYQRQGTTFEDTTFKVEVSGKFRTNWCEATGNTAKVTFNFLQDNTVFATQTEQSNTMQTITLNRDLTGDIIGVRLKLTDFNSNNLNAALGDGFEEIRIKITGNQTQEVLIDTNPSAWLVSCSDICHEVVLLYNTSTQQLSVDSIWL
jgi:hypothetical protein